MIKNIGFVLEHILDQIRNHTDYAVVGMSGGADSTLVATLCTMALGNKNVLGVGMPYGDTDKLTFNTRSEFTAERLAIKYITIPIGGIADEIVDSVQEILYPKPTEIDGQKAYIGLNHVNVGNARARARMAVLYAVAHELGSQMDKRVRVVGTGNLSEDFIGYDTKGGDALADFFPIGDLFKSEVYQLLDYFVEQGILTQADVDRIPSAGLWEGQTDAGELGYTYDEMEPAIRRIMANQYGPHDADEVTKFVWDMYRANKHKHEVPPIIKLRHLIKE